MTDNRFSLLLVDDEPDFLDATKRWMEHKGHTVATAAGGAEALELCRNEHFDVALLDLDMPGMSGIELLQRIGDIENDMEVIMLTGRGSIDTAVQAMKLGACDFLTKPCPLGDVEHRCQLAVERSKLRKENRQLKAVISRAQPGVQLIGSSPQMLHIQDLIRRVAPTDKPVLITGESGTGKEVVARLVQQNSGVANRPFVTVNCAALPEQLVESELFGHQKGSFTAVQPRKNLDCSRLPMVAVCSSMNWANCLWPYSRNCCEFWRTVPCGASVRAKNAASMCGSLPPRTAA